MSEVLKISLQSIMQQLQQEACAATYLEVSLSVLPLLQSDINLCWSRNIHCEVSSFLWSLQGYFSFLGDDLSTDLWNLLFFCFQQFWKKGNMEVNKKFNSNILAIASILLIHSQS